MTTEKLTLPDGTIYGGAPVFSARGQDGATYVVYCGTRPGKKFGTHAFKVSLDGTRQWIELPAFTEGRAGVTVEADGAYLTWPVDQDRAALRVKLPGFVPTDGKSPPVIPPVVPPPVVPPAECVDEEGRAYTSAVKKELRGALTALEERVIALEKGGADESKIRDIVWGLAPSAVYVDIQRPESGIRAVVKELQGIDREALKALVREVLIELLED